MYRLKWFLYLWLAGLCVVPAAQDNPRTLKLTFQWQGDLPAVSALEFLGTPTTLTAIQENDTVQVEVTTGLFTTLTIG